MFKLHVYFWFFVFDDDLLNFYIFQFYSLWRFYLGKTLIIHSVRLREHTSVGNRREVYEFESVTLHSYNYFIHHVLLTLL